MVKPATVRRIRTLSRQSKSSNEIVRQLRREGIGIRRKTILAYAREFRGRKPKAEPYKYTPRKYLTKERRIHIETELKQKHVAVYGKVKGRSKRLEAYGTGKGLLSLLTDAVIHPPKQRITRISTDRVKGLSQRAKYLDYKSEWDERPKIRS